MMPSTKSGRGLFALAAIAMFSASAADAQENLDAGKPAPKLFAESCVTCHRSPRGLANGRLSLTLYFFLQEHYVSNSSSAWTLASYLNSVDGARAEKRAAKSRRPAASNAGNSVRPPAPVPGR